MDSVAVYQQTLADILALVGARQSPESLGAIHTNSKNVLAHIFQRALLAHRRSLTQEIYRQSRGVIQKGAFAGLILPESFLHRAGPLAPSLLGTHEEELHPYWNRLMGQDIPLIVQVGAAEGYYAAGLARSMADSYLVVYEASPQVREKLGQSITRNGVADRVELRAECRRDELNRLLMDHPGAVVLMDCAGAEEELLDPEQIPPLRDSSFIVECHDRGDRLIHPILMERFQESHRLLLVQQSSRNPHDHPLLRTMEESARWLCVDEERSAFKQWLVGESKQPKKGMVHPRIFPFSVPVTASVENEGGGEVAADPHRDHGALADILALVGVERSQVAQWGQAAGADILTQIFTRVRWARLVGFTDLVGHFSQGWVQSGPFAGLRLLAGGAPRAEACLVPQWLGTYQEELHPHLLRVLNQRYPQIVVTGAAAGYYAVGLARHVPDSRLLVFDHSPQAGAWLEQNARANGVADRVSFHGACTPAGVAAILARQPGNFLLLDGGEAENFLDSEEIPGLGQSDFIVTCRDGGDPARLLRRMIRFQASHQMVVVRQGGRNPHAIPLLKNMTEHDRWLCVDENRPEGLYWLVAESKHSLIGGGRGRLIPAEPVFPPLLRGDAVVGPDRSVITICYAINGDFVRQMTVSLISLLLHNDGDRCEIFVLCDEGAYAQRQKVREILKRFRHRIEFILIDDFYRHLPARFYNSAIYFRLALPYVLNRSKVLYLDADTVIEADLTDLWQTDLAGALCAGVQDLGNLALVAEQVRLLGITSPYINSGVLLLDLAGWRREKIAEQILDFIAKNPTRVRLPDQNGINRILDGRKKMLDPRWNILCHDPGWQEQWVRAPQQHILHFTPHRPWEITGQPPLRKIWQRYEAFTPWHGAPLEKPIYIESWLQAAHLAGTYGEFEQAYHIVDELAEKIMKTLKEKEKSRKKER